ncbi:hypothetical protein BDQ17DRAFT_1332303 [Cyathus striatus]|nr:hypothetical protein BDQ17DRAFT_1332303 [Cyathus striatus]
MPPQEGETVIRQLPMGPPPVILGGSPDTTSQSLITKCPSTKGSSKKLPCAPVDSFGGQTAGPPSQDPLIAGHQGPLDTYISRSHPSSQASAAPTPNEWANDVEEGELPQTNTLLPTYAQRELWFWQQNMNDSLLGHQNLLVSLGQFDYDICAIQELYIGFNRKSCTNCFW